MMAYSLPPNPNGLGVARTVNDKVQIDLPVNHYAVLGVSRYATEDEIELKY